MSPATPTTGTDNRGRDAELGRLSAAAAAGPASGTCVDVVVVKAKLVTFDNASNTSSRLITGDNRGQLASLSRWISN